MTYYAHTVEGKGKEDWQTLSDHLEHVAVRAELFSRNFWPQVPHFASELAMIAGLLHDAGKCSSQFQRRLEGKNIHVDHSTAGAKIAVEKYQELGRLLSYILCGHHGGLPNAIAPGRRSSLESRLQSVIEPYNDFDSVLGEADLTLPSLSEVPSPFAHGAYQGSKESSACGKLYSFFFLEKMLYSSLVDADWLDTERVMVPDNYDLRFIRKPSLEELLAKLEVHLDRFTDDLFLESASAVPIDEARAHVSQNCADAAAADIGLFSLTVPTGGGKTLASLRFALRHALLHGQKRVIYSIPFTSIIDQTAKIFKEILGENAVIEHHSNFNYEDYENDEDKLGHRLAIQNWDASIIVTTNVQLLESLYADKPSKCRKLHNIAESVLVFDEAQTFPDSLLQPTLAALEELAVHYRTTSVLCTATQPALSGLWPFESKSREIIRNPESLKRAFAGRTRFEQLGYLAVDDLGKHVFEYNQALCIVNSRNAARDVYRAVCSLAGIELKSSESADEARDLGLYHLSALMIPVHRLQMIQEIKIRLKEKRPCCVISTQLIEAGVDVDFPVVFREMAGLDSLMQAAGRCNRSGSHKTSSVYIFEFEEIKRSRRTWLTDMKDLGKSVLRETGGVLDDAAVELFFRKRYASEDLDSGGIMADVCSREVLRTRFNSYSFERYAHEFHVIDDQSVSVFIPWEEQGRELLGKLRAAEFSAGLAPQIQRYSVSVPHWVFQEYDRHHHAVERIDPFFVIQPTDGCERQYRNDLGLLPPGEGDMELLVL